MLVMEKKADVINPATNELIDTVPLATEEDVDLCVKEAAKSSKKVGLKCHFMKEEIYFINLLI